MVPAVTATRRTHARSTAMTQRRAPPRDKSSGTTSPSPDRRVRSMPAARTASTGACTRVRGTGARGAWLPSPRSHCRRAAATAASSSAAAAAASVVRRSPSKPGAVTKHAPLLAYVARSSAFSEPSRSQSTWTPGSSPDADNPARTAAATATSVPGPAAWIITAARPLAGTTVEMTSCCGCARDHGEPVRGTHVSTAAANASVHTAASTLTTEPKIGGRRSVGSMTPTNSTAMPTCAPHTASYVYSPNGPLASPVIADRPVMPNRSSERPTCMGNAAYSGTMAAEAMEVATGKEPRPCLGRKNERTTGTSINMPDSITAGRRKR
mmetsp:Transcript_23177/g.57450  ORF Transcript_23177/g.57450 Transcript_23177/m.57450 type:complete len:324 (+) Transcript_23177:444-1415(+)